MGAHMASVVWKSRLACVVYLGSLAASGIGCSGIDPEEGAPQLGGDTDLAIESSLAPLTIGTVTPLEAESLTRSASTIGSKVTTEANASGGKYVEFNGIASAAGSWIEFTLPNVAAGAYDITFLHKANSNRGIVQASIDGTDQGSPCNQYATNAANQVQCALGSKALSAGNHTIRFRVTGKSSSSSGYQMVVDQIALTYRGQCVTAADCPAGYQACVANSCACRQKSAGNVLANPGFDGSLASWNANPSAYSSSDADGCPLSGSLKTASISDQFGQCTRVTASTRYYFGLRYRGQFHCGLRYYSGTSCQSSTGLGSWVDLYASTNPGAWTSMSTSAIAPAGTNSAWVLCTGSMGPGPTDQLYLTRSGGF